MYRIIVKIVRILLVLCLITMPAKNSWAIKSEGATDAAFAALLQMPGAEPKLGGWTIPEKYFKPESQEELIVFLGKMKEQGADFNAYRHLGTLLHHAIRANFIKTAKWLLAHGADPKLTLKSGNENALDLCNRYKRVQLAQMLISQYHVKANVKPAPPTAVYSRSALPSEAELETMSAHNLSDADIATIRKLQWLFVEGRFGKDGFVKWESFESKLPPEALIRVIDDPSSFSAFILFRAEDASRARSLADTIASLSAELVSRYINGAISEVARRVSLGQINVSAQAWQALWKYRNGPVDYSKAKALAEKMQPQLWGELFASGYKDRDPESALGCLLSVSTAAEFKNFWKSAENNFPNIRQVAPRMVLNGQRMADFNHCWAGPAKETAGKLRYLTSLGIKEEVNGIDASDWQSDSSELGEAIRPFLQHDAASAASPLRLVYREINCKLNMKLNWLGEINNSEKNKAWYYADKLRFQEGASQSIYSVQVVDIPGKQSCGLLVGGPFSFNVPLDPGGHDSFDGMLEQEPSPSCPSPWGGYQLLIDKDGKIEHIYTNLARKWNSGVLVAVKDASSNRNLFLRDEGGSGRCSGPRELPGLYEIATGQYDVTIDRVKDRSLEEELFAQCKVNKGSDNGQIACEGIDQALVNTEFQESRGIAYDDFLKRYYPDKATSVVSVPNDRAPEYEAALMRRDNKALNAIKSSGTIPQYWVTSALHKIIESNASNEEKRNSILWVLGDTKRFDAVTSDIYFLDELVPWLKRRDWQPILKRIEQPAPALDSLREAAAASGLAELGCDIDLAQGLVCGEEVSF